MVEDLVDLARKSLGTKTSHPSSSPEQESRTADQIRRRISRSGQGRHALQEFDALLQRLKELPNPPADLASVLALMSTLAFSAPSSAATPQPSRLSPIPGSASSSRTAVAPRSSYASNLDVASSSRYRREGASSSASLRHPESSRYGDSRPSSRAAVPDDHPSGLATPALSSTGSDGASTTARIHPPKLSTIDLNRRTAAAEVARVQEADALRKRADKADQRKEERDAVAPKTRPLASAAQPAPDLEQLGIGKVPKATLLERWRSTCDTPLVPEQELLRDVIFILQGINGRYVRFEEIKTPTVHDIGVIRSDPDRAPDPIVKVKIVEDDSGRIPLPTRHLIHRLAECGKHYQRITKFIQAQAAVEGSGRVMQSLCHFIDRELTEYYSLICALEAQLNEGPANAEAVPEDLEAMRAAARKTELSAGASRGLTLRKVAVETDEALLRMRFMSALVEGAQHSHGGSLVSLIHNYTFNGDPFIRSFTERLLEEVSRSFFLALSRWIYEGELQDPFKEFFVELNPDPTRSADGSASDFPEEVDAAALWENKFIFRPTLVPTFLGETFAKKIFSAGKSLNFIRYSCGDGDWKDTRALIEAQAKPNLRYADLAGLERTIDSVHSTVSKRLLDVFLDKFKLQDHLRAITDYLLLTKGDFADLLLETLSSILYKQASLLYRHSLTAALETAIRGSNAQYDDPDILRRLDARVLEFTGTETGWDTFTLEYRVDSPVNTVLDATAMAEYQQIFLHLWKMKRVELCLNASFGKMTSVTNGLLRIKKRDRDAEVLALKAEAHRALGLLAEMTHFMRQLQGYNQLEVIEYSWQDLQNFFEKRSGDLDVLIAAHKGYLSSLHGKILLRGGKRGAVDYLASELRANFNTIISFTAASDELATFIADELARRSLGDMETEDPRLRGILRKVGDHAHSFRERTDNIISRLERHSNLVSRRRERLCRWCSHCVSRDDFTDPLISSASTNPAGHSRPLCAPRLQRLLRAESAGADVDAGRSRKGTFFRAVVRRCCLFCHNTILTVLSVIP